MPEDPKERKRYLKNKQKFARYMRFYGKSLEKDIGKGEVITVTEPPSQKKGRKKEKKVSMR